MIAAGMIRGAILRTKDPGPGRLRRRRVTDVTVADVTEREVRGRREAARAGSLGPRRAREPGPAAGSGD